MSAVAEFRDTGTSLQYVAVTDLNGGDVVPAGDSVLIPINDTPTGRITEMPLYGAYRVAKTTGEAYSYLTRLYWDAGNQRVTATQTANGFGYSAGIASSSATECIAIHSPFSPIPEGASNPLTAAQIQDALDSTGYCKLGPGTFTIDTQIEIGDSQWLQGSGDATILRWTGSGNYAIKVGTGTNGYASRLSDLQIRSSNDSLYLGGGVEIGKMGKASSVENVTINRAKQHGVSFPQTASGESFELRNVYVSESVNDGLRVDAGDGMVIGLLKIEDCYFNANLEYGVNFSTNGTGTIQHAKFRDTEIQGNGRSTVAGWASDMRIAGRVTETLLDGCWLEPYTTYTKAGIRIESLSAVLPGQLLIVGMTRINNYYPWTTDNRAAILVIDSSRPIVIDDALIGPYNATVDSGATVRYKADVKRMRPIGLKRNPNAIDGTTLGDAADATYLTDYIKLDTGIS